MKKKRILIVDDSAVIRGMISRIIQEEQDIEIVGSAANGQMAVQFYTREKPDLVLLDIDMPIMDGIEALKEIMRIDRAAKVVMCSTLTQKNAEISMQAMALGAVDYIPKPETAREMNSTDDFKHNLLGLIRNLGSGRMPTASQAGGTSSSAASAAAPKPSATASLPGVGNNPMPSSVPNIFKGEITKRAKPQAGWIPKIVAIGSSTGGPQALFAVLKNLKNLPVPIVITQHMPPTFTALLAQHITAQTGIEAFEAADGMAVEAGKVYVAAGGKHMLLKKGDDGKVTLKLDDGPMENFCKPAVDPMMRSILAIYGGKTLGVMLTGMGTDGLEGMRALIDAGGFLVAQDSQTSVVWGMPGAVAKAGLCSEILPVQDIGPWVYKIVTQ